MKKLRYILLFAALLLVTLIFTNAIKPTAAISAKSHAGIMVGEKVPDIMLRNPEDSVISLYSIKNKLVLIDFWSSWCGPCRRENPNVVAAYKKYKDEKFKKVDCKGFTIFSVSLDKDKNAWKNAIARDSLIWPYHVSDLKSWYSPVAAMYGVSFIPSNFLIDKDGYVLAIELRGDALVSKLEELKNK